MKTRAVTEIEIRNATTLLNGRYQVRERCLFSFLHRTGFRLSEALSVRVADIYDADSRTVRDEVCISKRNMKGRQASRTVPLHAEAKLAILAWLSSSGLIDPAHGAAYLFRSQKGGRLTRVQAWRLIKRGFRQLGSASGCAAHSFRKRFGTDIYVRSGRCIVTTQLALGHTDPTHTSKYVDVARAQINNAILGIELTVGGD